MIHQSVPLKKFPKKVVLISDKKWGLDVLNALCVSFNRNGINTYVIDAKKYKDKHTYVKKMWRGDHKRTLIMYYDPGNMDGNYSRFTARINPPKDIPWGIYHGGSLYRVDNLEMREKRKLNHVRKMNKVFDDNASFVVCGTECLMGVNKKTLFLGYPMDFLPFNENKSPDSIGHLTTGVDGVTLDWQRELMKGSLTIEKAFKELDIPSRVVGMPKIPKEECMEWLDRTGMMVYTMTKWDSGFGRTSLEGCVHSCLGMSKNSRFAGNIKSPIVNVRTPQDIANQVSYFRDEPEQFHIFRRRQYDWAKDNFSMEAVANRFRNILKMVIEKGVNTRWPNIA